MDAAGVLQRFFSPGHTAKAPFVALSGAAGLRWILPANQAKTEKVLVCWRPYKLSSRLGWGAIRFAMRGGFLHKLPMARCADVDLSATDWRDFGWDRKNEPAVLAYVGTPGAHRKLVVTLADPDTGEGLLVVKFPLVDTAWPKIAKDYAALRELKQEGRKLGPAPLHIDHVRQFSVQRFLSGRPVRTRLGAKHAGFLASLTQPDKRIDLEAERVRLVQERERLIAAGRLPVEAQQQTAEMLAASSWQGQVPAVRIHGDFAPWNLRVRNDGSLCALDWEESEAEGLPFYDLHYYNEQRARLLRRRSMVSSNLYGGALTAMAGWSLAASTSTSCAGKMAALLAISRNASQTQVSGTN